MSAWPPPGGLHVGDRVLLSEHYISYERPTVAGTVTNVKGDKALYPVEVNFDNGWREIFEAHELEKLK